MEHHTKTRHHQEGITVVGMTVIGLVEVEIAAMVATAAAVVTEAIVGMGVAVTEIVVATDVVMKDMETALAADTVIGHTSATAREGRAGVDPEVPAVLQVEATAITQEVTATKSSVFKLLLISPYYSTLGGRRRLSALLDTTHLSSPAFVTQGASDQDACASFQAQVCVFFFDR